MVVSRGGWYEESVILVPFPSRAASWIANFVGASILTAIPKKREPLIIVRVSCKGEKLNWIRNPRCL